MLADGRVLVTGGALASKDAVASAEIYDPATARWTATGALGRARYGHAATVLADGRVLVVGGANRSSPTVTDLTTEPIPSAEVYDPATGTWRLTCIGPNGCASPGEHPQPRLFPAAARLDDGRVLVAGGLVSLRSPPTASTEVYDPAAGSGRAWAATGALPSARFGAAAAVLPGGRPFVVGGSSPEPLSDGAVLDPSGTWRAAPSMLAARGVSQDTFAIPGPTATVLSSDPHGFGADPRACGPRCGTVLVVGAGDPGAELYTPAPTVDSIVADSAPVAGGTRVTVHGTGFVHGVTAVTFGGAPASFSVDSYSQLTAVVPPAGGRLTVDVAVSGIGGTARWPGEFHYRGPPGAVGDLAAVPVSPTQVDLSFSAPGSGGDGPAPAVRFLVKLTRGVLTDAASFDAAAALCGGVCALAPARVGDRVTLSVTGLAPATTYRWALRALDGAGLAGPQSNTAEATTPEGVVTTTPFADPAGTRAPGAETNVFAAPATPPGPASTTPTPDAPAGAAPVAGSPVPPEGLLPEPGRGSEASRWVVVLLLVALVAGLGALGFALHGRYRGAVASR